MKRILNILLLLFVLFCSSLVNAQTIEWAYKVDTFSSQYSPDRHSAREVLGVPNVDPVGRSSQYAWAVEPNVIDKEGVESAYIEVSFKSILNAKQVAVFQSFYPGAVQEVFVKGSDNKWKSVYLDTFVVQKTGYSSYVTSTKKNFRSDEMAQNEATYNEIKKNFGKVKRKWWYIFRTDSNFYQPFDYKILNINFKQQEVKSVRVVMNVYAIDGWNEIDAIALSDSEEPVLYPTPENTKDKLFAELHSNPLNSNINTKASEIEPVITPDAKTLFFTRNGSKSTFYKHSQDFYFSNLSDNSQSMKCKTPPNKLRSSVYWDLSQHYEPPYNGIVPHSVMGFSADGKAMYISNLYKNDDCNCSDKTHEQTNGLSVSYLTTTEWTPDSSFYGMSKFSGLKNFHTNKQNNVMVCVDSLNLYMSCKNIMKRWKKPKYIGVATDSLFVKVPKRLKVNNYTMLFDTVGNNVKYKSIAWTQPKKVEIDSFENSSNYVNFSINKKGNVMLLSLKDKQSIGERDIYVSFLKEDSSWSAPKNLPTNINTLSDDCSPFVDDDNKTMFFASAGHNGYGDRDIYVTKRLDDTWLNWSDPLNVGQAVNTSSSDAFFNISFKDRMAYYASSDNMVCCSENSDIYAIQTLEPITILLTGTVYDAEDYQKRGKDAYKIGSTITMQSIQNKKKNTFANEKIIFTSDNKTGKYAVELHELVENDKIQEYAMTAVHSPYQQVDEKLKPLAYQYIGVKPTDRTLVINQDLYLLTGYKKPVDPYEKWEISDTTGTGPTIPNNNPNPGPVVQQKTDSALIVFLQNEEACKTFLDNQNQFLYYLSPYKTYEGQYEFKKLPSRYDFNFEYNETQINTNDQNYQRVVKAVKDSLDKHLADEGYWVKVYVLSSASRIQTRHFASNFELAEKRAHEPINRIQESLAAMPGVTSALLDSYIRKLRFESLNLVQGVETERDESVNKQYQFVKLWVLFCKTEKSTTTTTTKVPVKK